MASLDPAALQAAIARYQTSYESPDQAMAPPAQSTSPAYLPGDVNAAVARYQGAPAAPAGGAAGFVSPVSAPAPPAAMMSQPPVDMPATSAAGEMPAVNAAAPVPAQSAPEQPWKPPTFDSAIRDYQHSTATAAQSVRQEAESHAQSLEQESALAGQQADELAERQRAFEADQKERTAVREHTLQEFQRLSEQATNMRVVDNRTTGQRVVGAIAVALGAIGDGFSRMGGINNTDGAGNVQRILDEQVQQDLQSQREAIDGTRKAAASKLTELGLARSAFDDAQQAEQFATAQIQLKYASQLKKVATSNAPAEKRAAAEMAAANIEADASAKIAGLVERRDEQKMKSQIAARQHAGGGGGGAFNPSEILRRFDSQDGSLNKQEMAIALQLDRGRDAEQRAKDQLAARKESDAARAAAKENAPEKLSEGQQKARALYEAAAKPLETVRNALAAGQVPSWKTVQAANSSVIPDSTISKVDAAGLKVYRDAERLVNDDLRDESGAAIGKDEKDGLLQGLRSSDEQTRRDSLQRILDKTEAMGGKAGRPKPQAGATRATGGETRQGRPFPKDGQVPTNSSSDYDGVSAPPGSGGMAAAIRLSDGKLMRGPKDKVDAAIASGKYKAAY